MNILLTGGTGYIGSHVAVVLAGAGHKIILYDNFCNSSPSVAERLHKITEQHFDSIEGDTRDAKLLKQILSDYKIDTVIHLAGLKAVGESKKKPIDYYDNNVGGTLGLLQAMAATKIKTLVFSSSATVYGNPRYLPIDEEHPLKATNVYGRTKIQIEEILSDVAIDNSWHIAILRYFNPVGAHESGLIGEEPKGIPNNLVPYITRVASGQLPYLNVFGNDYPAPDGTCIRDYIHVMDLADGHLQALDYVINSLKSPWCVFNLGTGRGSSVLEVIKTFESATGKSIPYKIVGRREGDVATCYTKVEKAKRELKWEAKRNLVEMCTSAWKFLWQVKKF